MIMVIQSSRSWTYYVNSKTDAINMASRVYINEAVVTWLAVHVMIIHKYLCTWLHDLRGCVALRFF